MDFSAVPLYPLRFRPILKQCIWGGTRIVSFKHLSVDLPNVGESWEISGVAGHESVVAEGPLEGIQLSQVLAGYGEKLVGKHNFERFGTTFPLLVKFIDANRDLSIQVHPSDELARRRNCSLGKSEMWYVIDAQKDAQIVSGLSAPLTTADYRRRVEEGSITEVLEHHEAHRGDVFYLPAGRIHAIGAGVFLAEIQETSDVTYRIYDYGRLDRDGRPRELHTELAEEAIDYRVFDDYRTYYLPKDNGRVELLATPHFIVALNSWTTPFEVDYGGLDSFVIWLCVEGGASLSVTCSDGATGSIVTEHALRAGESLLIPATATHVHAAPSGGEIKFLESYL